MARKRVIVAMSGGLDSSVAALLLKRKGYEVSGLTMDIGSGCEDDSSSNRVVSDAKEVAQELGIPHHVVHLREEFTARVIDNFCQEYLQGRTPNPCIVCNRYIKFGALLRQALALGADYLATGHYVRVRNQDGQYILLAARDPKKDQSYVLYSLNQHQLAHTLFPLGEYIKDEIREIAWQSGLAVAERTESQEICFVTVGSYGDFVEAHRGDAVVRNGVFRNTAGKYLGDHRGIHRYTIGQRKGLGLALGKPVFVTGIDPDTNTVWLGESKELFKLRLVAKDIHYISGVPFPGPKRVTVKIRYSAPKVDATAIPLGDGSLRVDFAKPQRAITPGQAVVLYEGEQVLGGGTIAEVL